MTYEYIIPAMTLGEIRHRVKRPELCMFVA